MNRRKIFCLMGATATGKTDIACKLSEYFPLEIISIDSAMIYRGMNIGTAKPDLDTLKLYPHHLIDIIDPVQSYSVANCVKDVNKLVDEIFKRDKLPLLVGGTMMYFHALQNGLANLPVASEDLRAQILSEAASNGWEFMHAKLAKLDSVSAERINPRDKSRIQRALEVYILTTQSIADLQTREDNYKSAYEFINILLMPDDRSWLHKRIAERFTNMLNCGLIAEVAGLLAKWPLHADHSAMRCVGYRQVFAYLQGDLDYATMQEKGIVATRQLAKRQLTWLRKWPNAHVFPAEGNNLLKLIELMKR